MSSIMVKFRDKKHEMKKKKMKGVEEEEMRVTEADAVSDKAYIMRLPTEILIIIFKMASVKGVLKITNVNNLRFQPKVRHSSLRLFKNLFSKQDSASGPFHRLQLLKNRLLKRYTIPARQTKYLLAAGQGLEEESAMVKLELTCKRFNSIISSPSFPELKDNLKFYERNLFHFQDYYSHDKYFSPNHIKRDMRKGIFQPELLFLNQLPEMLRSKLKYLMITRSVYHLLMWGHDSGFFDFECLSRCRSLEGVKLLIDMERTTDTELHEKHAMYNRRNRCAVAYIHACAANINHYMRQGNGRVKFGPDEFGLSYFSIRGLKKMQFEVYPIWSKYGFNLPFIKGQWQWDDDKMEIAGEEFNKFGKVINRYIQSMS